MDIGRSPLRILKSAPDQGLRRLAGSFSGLYAVLDGQEDRIDADVLNRSHLASVLHGDKSVSAELG
jgi:hypothetical protein